MKLVQRVYNSSSIDQVDAIWIEGNTPNLAHECDIIIHTHSGHKHTLKHYYGCYESLKYLLLFPKGYVGFKIS